MCLLALAAPGGAAAYDGGDASGAGAHGATSIGPRAVFYRPTDADRGVWAPGAQLRLHLTPAYVLEGSVDFPRYASSGAAVRATVIQTTLVGYFYPETTSSPYLLIGGGWYPVRADARYVNPYRRFGPHVGAGLELILGGSLSLDGSYRYLWTQDVGWSKLGHLFGRDYAKRGFMYTLSLNYRL